MARFDSRLTRDFINPGQHLEGFSNSSVSLDQREGFLRRAGFEVSGMQCDVPEDCVSDRLVGFRFHLL
jgi:hypothetical protein